MATEIALIIIVLGSLFVLAASTTTFLAAYRLNTQRIQERLQDLLLGRAHHENRLYESAERYIEVFKTAFMDMYLSDREFNQDDFDRLYARGEEGETRMREAFFQPHLNPEMGLLRGMSSFIGNNQQTSDPDFQRRLIIAYLLVARFGPAWFDDAGGLHASYPENAITIYHPDLPWGLMARADLTMNEYNTIASTLQSRNPERNPVWTGLYHDSTADAWTITYQLPMDWQGRHLVNPSFDFFLDTQLRNLILEAPQSAYLAVFTENGYLVASPDEPTEADQRHGTLLLEEIENTELSRVFELIRTDPPPTVDTAKLVDDRDGRNWIFATQLSGPGWFYALVYPKALVSAEARETSNLILIVGAVIFLINAVVVVIVLRKKVQKPLSTLVDIIGSISNNDFAHVDQSCNAPHLHRGNEISELTAAIGRMNTIMRDYSAELEHAVKTKTRELLSANAKLQSLSILDSLTGLHNRRAFDADLKRVFGQSKDNLGTFGLFFADVDDFKKYNDTYGHNAGDAVLKAVAESLAGTLRAEDRAYRYGGEEFVIILNGAERTVSEDWGRRLIAEVHSLGIEHSSSRSGVVTISAGLAFFDTSCPDVQSLVELADSLLYEAKAQGKNRLVVNIAVGWSQKR